jgi:hypothetical protein
MQVSRWGLPLVTHLLLNDPGNKDVKETFNKSVPSDDIALFSGHIADYIQKMVTYAGSAVNPEEYARQMVSRLCPNTMPYELGTAAAFDVAGFNGRPLGDDVMDVMLTLASNRPLQDGAAPDRNRIRTEFPYFGEPYSKEEQKDVVPWRVTVPGKIGRSATTNPLDERIDPYQSIVCTSRSGTGIVVSQRSRFCLYAG